jgi:threonylcarbamoyladenosine tRNA methylthiotransferase MtaB
VEQLPMTYLHVFPYSLRPDTPAQRLADHTTGPVKRERVRQLLQLGDSKRLGFHRSQVGATVSVLVEQIDGHGLASGLTDNYVRVRFESGPTPLRVNELVAVELTHARETETFGQRVAAA